MVLGVAVLSLQLMITTGFGKAYGQGQDPGAVAVVPSLFLLPASPADAVLPLTELYTKK